MSISYLSLNPKTQVITPTLLGELIYEVVNASIRQLLNPELTASWEKGLTYVAEGSITEKEYMEKLQELLVFSLPLYAEEGKTELVIAVGCTGGHHRSVAMTHALAENIQKLGYRVRENHRDMNR